MAGARGEVGGNGDNCTRATIKKKRTKKKKKKAKSKSNLSL